MNCPAILTGDDFLMRVLSHIDCQAQAIGTFGWQALAQPGSLASILVTGLLTIFVALFGIRLLFGSSPGARDVVSDIVKIGFVLTFAFSWPAFRTVIHDVVLSGPAEIVASVGSSASDRNGSAFASQLQAADNAIVRLTEAGTGRNVGAFIDSEAPGGTFRGSALEDDNTFGWARLAYLAGIIGSLALLRLVAGLLLALAPLAAGLLLFEATRGLFSGWLRGLVLALLGSIGVTIVLVVQLAIIRPWLDDVLRLRSAGYATPAAPIELLAMTVAFAIVQFAIIWLLAKIAFTRGWLTIPSVVSQGQQVQAAPTVDVRRDMPAAFAIGRAQRMADSMEIQVKREEAFHSERTSYRSLANRTDDGSLPSNGSQRLSAAGPERLGTTWRRTSQRSSVASRMRDSET